MRPCGAIVFPTVAVLARSKLVPLKPSPAPNPRRKLLLLPIPLAAVVMRAQAAEELQIWFAPTPEELTLAQLDAVVGSQRTTFARPDADVANGTGVVTTIGDKDCAAIFTLKVLPAA